MMKERFLLLNNFITIGIFIEELEIGKARPSDGSSSFTHPVITSQHVIMILLSRNGRYFRVYDNHNLVKSREAILNPEIFNLFHHDYYENHISEYVHGCYQSYLEKLLLFRNVYLLNQDDIYWSKRLLKGQTSAIPTEKVLEILENCSSRLLTHWILTAHQNPPFSSPSPISSPHERHVRFPDEQEEWKRIAEDVLTPEANNLSVCPFNLHLRLIYTIYIKEDDHHLYDHYLQNRIDEVGKVTTNKYKKTPSVNPFLPGYYEYVWTTIIPIAQFHHHRLISSLVTKLYFHFAVKKNDYPMDFERVMCSSTDETSNYSQEVKELETLSPYLTPLLASPANIINLEKEENIIIKEEELDDLYKQRDRDNRYPLFNTLPFFIMKERYDGYDYSNIFPVQTSQIAKDDKVLHWLKTLCKLQNDDECSVNNVRTNQVEVWAYPTQLIQTTALSSTVNTSIPFPSLLLFTKDIFYLLKKNKITERNEIASLHSNMMSHLLLTSNMNEFESNLLHSDKNNNISVQSFRTCLKVLPRMMFYSQYLHDITPIAQHYYQLYSKDHYRLKDEKTKSSSTSNILYYSESNNRSRQVQMEEFVTEEYFENGLKYTVIVAPDLSLPTSSSSASSSSSSSSSSADVRNIVKIQASYTVDRTIIHYYFSHQRFEVLFPEGQEAKFSLHDYQQQLGIFHVVKHHQQQDMTRMTKTRFEEQVIDLIPKLEKILHFSHWMQFTPRKRESMLKQQELVLQQAKALQYQNYLQLKLQQIHIEYERMRQEKRALERQKRRIKALVGDEEGDISSDEEDEVAEEEKEEDEDKDSSSSSESEVNEEEEEESEDRRRINLMRNPALSSSSFDMSLLETTFISPFETPNDMTLGRNDPSQTPGIFDSVVERSERSQSQRKRISLKDQMQEIQSNYELELKEKEIESTNMKKYILQTVRETLEQSELIRQRNEEYLRHRFNEARSLCEFE